LKQSLIRIIAIALFITLIGAGVDFYWDFEAVAGLTTLFQFRGQRQTPEQVVIIAMDEQSEASLGVSHDLPRWRGLHAHLIEELQRQGVALIVFDLQFIAPDNEHDQQVATSMRLQGHVLLTDCVQKFRHGVDDFYGRTECSEQNKTPAVTQENNHPAQLSEQLVALRRISPEPIFSDAALDHSPYFLISDSLNTPVREAWTYYDDLAEAPSLPLLMFASYFAQNNSSAKPYSDWLAKQRRNCLGNHDHYILPLSLPAAQQQMLTEYICGPASRILDYYGPPKTFRMEAYGDVYLGKTKNLAGKVVLVGKVYRQYSPGNLDVFQTPFTNDRQGKMAGVEIMATQFANLLENRFIETPLPFTVVCFVFAVMLMTLLVLFQGLKGFVLGGLAAGAYATAGLAVFIHYGWWLPVAGPLVIQLPLGGLLALACSRKDLLNERKRMLDFVGKVFPQWQVIQPSKPGYWQERNYSAQALAERNVTGVCLATDIESYTTISSQSSSHQLWELLNAYYDVLGRPVNVHNGIIADVTGDAMMAVWVDLSESTQRLSACLAALDMVKAVAKFNLSSDLSSMPTRIGLNLGEMTLGRISAGNTNHFRVIGDTVNTTSRIEGVNKVLGTRVLACQSLVEDLDTLCCRPMGEFRLVGRPEPVALTELISLKANVSEKQLLMNKLFSIGLKAFQQGDWPEAIKRFSSLLERHGTDGPTRFYLDLARINQQTADMNWNGFVILDRK
jgi:adenylate cyclase